MNKIPTAEEFLRNKNYKVNVECTKAFLIEFAKMHVKPALKEASENAKANYNAEVDKDSILNAYPLENIK